MSNRQKKLGVTKLVLEIMAPQNLYPHSTNFAYFAMPKLEKGDIYITIIPYHSMVTH